MKKQGYFKRPAEHSLNSKGIRTTEHKLIVNGKKINNIEGDYTAVYLTSLLGLNSVFDEGKLQKAVKYLKTLGYDTDNMTIKEIETTAFKEAMNRIKLPNQSYLYVGGYRGYYNSDSQIYDKNKNLSISQLSNQVEERLKPLIKDDDKVYYMYCIDNNTIHIVLFSTDENIKLHRVNNEFWKRDKDKFDLSDNVTYTSQSRKLNLQENNINTSKKSNTIYQI